MSVTMTDIEAGVRGLLDEHGLTAKGWRFDWDNATRRAGACHYRTRKVTLSWAIFSHSDEARAAWRDTALHEIAHALAGSAAAHGLEWRRVARSIGCSAQRCHALPTPPRPIVGTCTPSCPSNAKRDRARMPKPGHFYRCRICGARIEWWDRNIYEGKGESVIQAGLDLVAASVLAPDSVPDDKAARRSAAARKAWATRRAAKG